MTLQKKFALLTDAGQETPTCSLLQQELAKFSRFGGWHRR